MSAPHLYQGDPRVPHQKQPVLGAEGARTARHHATIVATLAAVVPTVLAMQGMAALAMDVLHFPLLAAIALAGFLELALVSSALLARASALAGRPGGADATAVWVVSVVSGLLSSTHEFVGLAVAGGRGWQFSSGSLLAAGVRIVAPLVAAWLWERVLVAARREHATRTLVELRRDRRLLGVARAALAVRRIEVDRGVPTSRRLRRARRRLDHAHLAALRTAPPGNANLATWLTAVGAVDILPSKTIVTDLDVWAPASQASHRGPDPVNQRAGSPGQGEPARESGNGPEWTTPNQVDHEEPAQAGPGWLTEPQASQGEPAAGSPDPAESAREPGVQLERTIPDQVSHPVTHEPETVVTEWATGPQVESVSDQVVPVLYQAESARVGRVSRVPVVAPSEAAIKNAAVLDLADEGLSQRKIALRLGISQSAVSRVIARSEVSESPESPESRDSFGALTVLDVVRARPAR